MRFFMNISFDRRVRPVSCGLEVGAARSGDRAAGLDQPKMNRVQVELAQMSFWQPIVRSQTVLVLQ